MAPGNESSKQPSPSSAVESTPALPSYPGGSPSKPPLPSAAPPPAASSASDAITLAPTPAPVGEDQPSPLSPEQLWQLAMRLDGAMPPLVLALAFLVACFTIRNSDLLMHLATGRFLVESFQEGQLANLFGYEPFAHTTAGVYWVNHSWLLDLVLYGLFLAVGGIGLVIIKALLSTVLAWVMLRLRRPNQSLWTPAACTGLAVLALSPRLILQPTIISFLFLVITLWLLTLRETTEARAGGAKSAPAGRHLWLLPPLFLLWVNVDSWFLLGPLTVGLYLLGEVLQDAFGPARTETDVPPRGERRMLIQVLIVGLLACLVNPHHVRAFIPPPQLALGEVSSLLQRDAAFEASFLSPFSARFWERNIGLSVAGMSYFALVLAGVVSFALNGGPGSAAAETGWRWWRGLVWLAFFLLSAYHARAIPFFAVVAGPITALNLQDFAARSFGTGRRIDDTWKGWSLGGRAVTLVIGVALLICAWPGWLQARPYDFRRVSWGMAFEPALEQASKTLAGWRKSGLLGEQDHGFSLAPEMTNYMAWYSPEEKGFFDQRLQPFDQVAADYVKIQEGLRPSDEELIQAFQIELDAVRQGIAPPRHPDQPWHKIFRDRGIKYVVLHRVRLVSMMRWMLTDPDQWTLLYLDGRVAIMG